MGLSINEAELPSSSFPVNFAAQDSKMIRTPGLGHPCIVVQETDSASPTPPDSSSAATVLFPPVAIYCQPPTPTVSTPSSSRSPSPMHRQQTQDVGEASDPAKQLLCARLSVPTDGPLRRRSVCHELSRSNSHPLHRNRRRSRSGVASNVDEPHQ